eukprot:TRINITY_DN4483_c0_g1_i1.p1 TRINITY_DN4483_c0_g1~~TRINITY_DN4483_c0_g1_i1.p1  ORF type:complete len:493 (-),score=140.05 TRINITY_DN4483_c0_g1_i1:922-2400(-)
MEGKFEDLEAILPHLNLQEEELLADFLTELFLLQNDLTPLICWCASLQSNAIKHSEGEKESEFSEMLRRRSVFSDRGVEYFKSFVVDYYNLVMEKSRDIYLDSMDGKESVCEIVDFLIESFTNSLPNAPTFMRFPVCEIHEAFGRGDGALDRSITVLMNQTSKFITDPYMLGFLLEPPQGKVYEVLKECGKLWTAIANQNFIEEDPYRYIIYKHNERLNDFIAKFYDRGDIERCKSTEIVGKIDENEVARAATQLAEFLECVELNDGASCQTAFCKDDELSEEDAMMLANKMGSPNWKVGKVTQEGIIYWELKDESTQNAVCARVDAKINASLGYATHFIERNILSSIKGTYNLSSFQVKENYRQFSFHQKYPFPFSNRFISGNSWVSMGETDSICFFGERPSETPQNLVRSVLHPSGAYIKISDDDPESLDVSMILHYELHGSLPKWVIKDLHKTLFQKMAKVLQSAGSEKCQENTNLILRENGTYRGGSF